MGKAVIQEIQGIVAEFVILWVFHNAIADQDVSFFNAIAYLILILFPGAIAAQAFSVNWLGLIGCIGFHIGDYSLYCRGQFAGRGDGFPDK